MGKDSGVEPSLPFATDIFHLTVKNGCTNDLSVSTGKWEDGANPSRSRRCNREQRPHDVTVRENEWEDAVRG
jgi:hypothetical protein